MLTKLMGLLVINSLDYVFALLQTKPNHEFVIMTEASFESLSHDYCWIADHLPMSLVLFKPLKSSVYGSRNPLQPPMQFVLRSNAEPHTRSGVCCKYVCMFTMESCFRLCGVRGNMCDRSMSGCSLCGRKWGFILQWLFQAEQGMGKRCRGRKKRRKRRETNFVQFQHLAESLHTKACYSESVRVKSAISRY